MAGGPGIIAKTSLTTGRAIQRPFAVPTRMNESSALVGAAAEHAVGSASKSIGDALNALGPRGPMKSLANFFSGTMVAIAEDSANKRIANHGRGKPIADASDALGTALASPFAAGYLSSIGAGDRKDLIDPLLRAPWNVFPKLEELPAPAPPPGTAPATPPATDPNAPAPDPNAPAPDPNAPAPQAPASQDPNAPAPSQDSGTPAPPSDTPA